MNIFTSPHYNSPDLNYFSIYIDYNNNGSFEDSGEKIYSKLVSLVFPLVDFNIALNYAVKIPAVVDGLYKWDYTISGLSGGTSFSYTTSDGFISDCNAQCCTSKEYLKLF